MCRRAWLAGAVVALSAGSWAQAAKPDAQTEAEVKAALEAYAKAYAAKDIKGAMDLIAPDAETSFTGCEGDESLYVGFDQVKKGHEQDFSEAKSIRAEVTPVAIGVKGDVAWFSARMVFHWDTGAKKLLYPGRWTGVLEKRDGKWLFVQSHFSLPTEGLPDPDANK
jgi:ketosteroid isomerase-like protein